jgi:hypothetical protein
VSTPSPQTPEARLLVEFDLVPNSRLEGRIRAAAGGSWTPFSGVLELLKVLQETLTAVRIAALHRAKKGID